MKREFDVTPWGGYYAVFIQFLVLAIAMAMVGVFIFLPLLFKRRDTRNPLAAAAMAVYFFCIGIAYIFVEITLMQKTTILFGSPIYPLGFIMGSMLLATGVGSLSVKKIIEDTEKLKMRLLRGVIGLIFLMGVFIGCGEILLGYLGTAAFFWRVAFVVAFSSLLGFIFGFFFPSGIALWRRCHPMYIPWAYAINSGSTVTATMLAILIAQLTGFRFLFIIALCLYSLALVMFFFQAQRVRDVH